MGIICKECANVFIYSLCIYKECSKSILCMVDGVINHLKHACERNKECANVFYLQLVHLQGMCKEYALHGI